MCEKAIVCCSVCLAFISKLHMLHTSQDHHRWTVGTISLRHTPHYPPTHSYPPAPQTSRFPYVQGMPGRLCAADDCGIQRICATKRTMHTATRQSAVLSGTPTSPGPCHTP